MHVEKVTHEYDTEAWRFALPRAAVFKGLPGPFPATQARPVIYSHCFLLLKKKKKKKHRTKFQVIPSPEGEVACGQYSQKQERALQGISAPSSQAHLPHPHGSRVCEQV